MRWSFLYFYVVNWYVSKLIYDVGIFVNCDLKTKYRTVPLRMKNEKTLNHLEHLSAQEYLSSSFLHPSRSINCDPFGQQQIEALASFSVIVRFSSANSQQNFQKFNTAALWLWIWFSLFVSGTFKVVQKLFWVFISLKRSSGLENSILNGFTTDSIVYIVPYYSQSQTHSKEIFAEGGN